MISVGNRSGRFVSVWPRPYLSLGPMRIGFNKQTRCLPVSEKHWVQYASRTVFVIGGVRIPAVCRGWRLWDEGIEKVSQRLKAQ